MTAFYLTAIMSKVITILIFPLQCFFGIKGHAV